jgi:hypothetical protein
MTQQTGTSTEHSEATESGLRRSEANRTALQAFVGGKPFLVDVRPAGEVMPALRERVVLTSGAPLDWSAYEGGQRRGVLGAVLYEGWATTVEEADRMLASGEIRVEPCHDHGAVGSVTGVYSASTPVLVVRDEASGVVGYCSVYEGSQRERLTYGVWNDGVRRNLERLRDVLGPALGRALRSHGPVDLAQVMRRGIRMGDDLHSRTTASSALLARELAPTFLGDPELHGEAGRAALDFLCRNDLFFLHVGMAAGKAVADAAHGIGGSSVVTAMNFSEKEFAIRVSGLPGEWFRAPVPPFQGKFFDGFTEQDRGDMGGESLIMETNGFGGMASAAAFPLQEYSGGSPEWMVENNRRMYAITLGENAQYRIPYLSRGIPAAIDVFKVVSTGITPTIHAGAGHRDGGHIGAGIYQAPLECFTAAMEAHQRTYGR